MAGARFWKNLMGLKLLMAVSGLVWVGFLVIHLIGNLLVFQKGAINSYAETLEHMPLLVIKTRIILFLAFFTHVVCAWILVKKQKAARPVSYQKKIWKQTSWASRTMIFSGAFILVFLCYHLAHLTLGITHPSFASLPEEDLEGRLRLSFSQGPLVFFYILGIGLLMTHLYHGLVSLWGTLGLSWPLWDLWIKRFCKFYAIVLALGFMSIPLSLYLGWI